MHVVDGNGQTGGRKRLFGRLEDIVDVSMPVLLLGPIFPTLPVAIDDELVCDLFAPRDFDGTGKSSVAFNQTNGRRPLRRVSGMVESKMDALTWSNVPVTITSVGPRDGLNRGD